MRILLATLIVLLFSTQAYSARSECDASCQAHKDGVSKNLRSYKGPMVCLQFKQVTKGSVKMTLYRKQDKSIIQTWQNMKPARGQMCVPAHLIAKADYMVVCGCKTPTNPEGRWQQVNLTVASQREALKRGTVLPLCRNK